MHIDEYGLIVQADGDGGDTAQRMGFYWFGVVLRAAVRAKTFAPKTLLRPIPAADFLSGCTLTSYVRHPAQDESFRPGETFRNDPKEFSRDQQRPLVMMMGAWGMKEHLRAIFVAHIKRLGKYQNKDYAGPSHWGEYIRAFRAWWLWPLLLVTDVALFFNSLATVVSTRGKPDDSDDNNHIMSLLQAQYFLPTPVSYTARKFYKLLRPRNYGNVFKNETCAVKGALSWYHRKENGGNPELADLYRPLVERM